MYGGRPSFGTALLKAGVAWATGYAGASVAKATGKPLTSAALTVGAGVVGFLARDSVRPQWAKDALEALGPAGMSFGGVWTAANTTTLGGKAAGSIPLQDVAASAGVQRALAEARARAAAVSAPVPAGGASVPALSGGSGSLRGYRGGLFGGRSF